MAFIDDMRSGVMDRMLVSPVLAKRAHRRREPVYGAV